MTFFVEWKWKRGRRASPAAPFSARTAALVILKGTCWLIAGILIIGRNWPQLKNSVSSILATVFSSEEERRWLSAEGRIRPLANRQHFVEFWTDIVCYRKENNRSRKALFSAMSRRTPTETPTDRPRKHAIQSGYVLLK
jgi:hypothetical protein